MEMTSLRLLHCSMPSIGGDMQQFLVRSGVASFDCLFSTRDTPFVLTLTARGKARGFSALMFFRAIGLEIILGICTGILWKSSKRTVPVESGWYPKNF